MKVERTILSVVFCLLVACGCSSSGGQTYPIEGSGNILSDLEYAHGQIFVVSRSINGKPKLSKSSDGGKSWKFADEDFLTKTDANNVHSVAFATAKFGLFSTPAQTYKTTDGGDTWTEHKKHYRAFDFADGTLAALSTKGGALHLLNSSSLESERKIGRMIPQGQSRNWVDLDVIDSESVVMWSPYSLAYWDGDSDDPKPIKLEHIVDVDAEKVGGKLSIWALTSKGWAKKNGFATELVALEQDASGKFARRSISLVDIADFESARALSRTGPEKAVLLALVKQNGKQVPKLFVTDNGGESWSEGPQVSTPDVAWNMMSQGESGDVWLAGVSGSQVSAQKLKLSSK